MYIILKLTSYPTDLKKVSWALNFFLYQSCFVCAEDTPQKSTNYEKKSYLTKNSYFRKKYENKKNPIFQASFVLHFICPSIFFLHLTFFLHFICPRLYLSQILFLLRIVVIQVICPLHLVSQNAICPALQLSYTSFVLDIVVLNFICPALQLP